MVYKPKIIKYANQIVGTLLGVLLVLYFPSAAWAQQAPSTEQKIAQAAVVGLFDALAELDAEKARSFCTAGVTLLESGKIWNFDSLALRIGTQKTKTADFKRVNKLDFIDTRISNETAWIAYSNQASITSSGKTIIVKWLESVVLKKSSNGWKIDLLHSTELFRTP